MGNHACLGKEARQHLRQLASHLVTRYNLSKSQATFSLMEGTLLGPGEGKCEHCCPVQCPFKAPGVIIMYRTMCNVCMLIIMSSPKNVYN